RHDTIGGEPQGEPEPDETDARGTEERQRDRRGAVRSRAAPARARTTATTPRRRRHAAHAAHPPRRHLPLGSCFYPSSEQRRVRSARRRATTRSFAAPRPASSVPLTGSRAATEPRLTCGRWTTAGPTRG